MRGRTTRNDMPLRNSSLPQPAESQPARTRHPVRAVLSKLLLVAASVLVSLGALEVLLRLYLLNHTFYDVEMTRYALLLKEESPNPRIGHIHRPNTGATLMNVPVHINADGLRDRDHNVAHGKEYRIVLLGDSFTFGWGVSEPETFKARLETALNQRYPTEIINLGTGNYNSDQELNLFLEKGLKYAPDKVVVFYFINDAERTVIKHTRGFFFHSRLVTFVWSKVHALLSGYGDEVRGYKGYYADLYRPENPGWQATRAALVRLRDICREHGIQLQVVIIPELHQLQDYPFADEHRLVTDFLRQHDIAVLDLAPAFKNETEPTRLWVSPDDAHANALGHELIAKYALDFIAQRAGGGSAAPPQVGAQAPAPDGTTP